MTPFAWRNKLIHVWPLTMTFHRSTRVYIPHGIASQRRKGRKVIRLFVYSKGLRKINGQGGETRNNFLSFSSFSYIMPAFGYEK